MSGPTWIPGKIVKLYIPSPDSTPTHNTEKQQETQLSQTQVAWRRKRKNLHPQPLPNNLETNDTV